jgi:mRNA interferase MazF
MVDLGMVAKVRPCVVLTPIPKDDELDVFTVVAHTTSRRGNRWEVLIAKPFLDDEGAFDVQRVVTVARVKIERKLGELSSAELDSILAGTMQLQPQMNTDEHG